MLHCTRNRGVKQNINQGPKLVVETWPSSHAQGRGNRDRQPEASEWRAEDVLEDGCGTVDADNRVDFCKGGTDVKMPGRFILGV
jgi:hypothetical protein